MTEIIEPLGTRAYQELWRRIVHLDYPPLTPLQDKQLSLELGFGLAPVRQALRRLEYDGLVMILPRRGTLTTEIGIRTVQWELEIREELEGLAGRLATKRGSREQHDELLDLVDRLEACAQQPDTLETHTAFTDLDSAFHRSIHLQTHNPSLVADLDRHFSHSLRIWHYCHRHADTEFTLDGYDTGDYRVIAEAIRARDADLANETLRAHVRRDTETALRMLRGVDV